WLAMTSVETPLFSEMLRQELARRSARNPRYSLRAFAKSVDASPAFLSRVLAGKRTPSAKMARQLADSLGFSGAERKQFVASVAAFRAAAPLASEQDDAAAATRGLENDLYDVIGDLNHLAILEMTFIDGFKSDPRAIARELGITTLEA